MSQKLLTQKTLGNGSELSLFEYSLSSEAKDALGLNNSARSRSSEMILELKGDYGSDSTQPRASWYLTREEYHALFGVIMDEVHFRNIANVLNKIKSEEDARKVREKGLSFMIFSAFSQEVQKNL